MKKIIIAILLVSITSLFAKEAIKAQKEIVGTWRFALVDGKEFPGEFYMKFTSDSIAKSWPSPHEGSFNTKDGVSTGDYRIDEEFFYIVKEKSKDIKSRYELTEDTFTMKTEDGHVLVYHRVKNPPEPGQLKGTQNKTE